MSFLEKLGPKLLTGDKKLTSTTILAEQKFIGIYLGSKWSPASQAFLPKLIDFYKGINEGETVLEIVYLSWDSGEKDFVEELERTPWLAIPFKQKLRFTFYNEFKELFPGLPSFVIFDTLGELIEVNGRREIELNNEEFTENLKKQI